MLTMVAWGWGHVLWGLIGEGNFSLYSLQYAVDFFSNHEHMLFL